MADDAALLGELAAALDPTDAKAVAGAPAPLGRRALREWLRVGHPPDLATVERVLSVASGSVAGRRHRGGQERPALTGKTAHRATASASLRGAPEDLTGHPAASAGRDGLAFWSDEVLCEERERVPGGHVGLTTGLFHSH